MSDRPELNKNMKSSVFMEYYYLKKELTDFCRENGLPVSGGKRELEQRIVYYLDTGMILSVTEKQVKDLNVKSGYPKTESISKSSIIEPNIHCTEIHRAFFKEQIGKGFTFQVGFQKWLKNNAGKTYGDAIDAYYQIQRHKKSGKTVIDKQFEYNTYIRDFFEANKGKSLQDAISCWNYKKSIPGHNRYEETDLVAILTT